MTIAKYAASLGSSEVMRSLERVALKKGMLQLDDPIVKSAAKKEAYEASGDLQADMLKLASGLRKRGYEKEANDLEDKIFNYKRAACEWYDVTGEEGEDLIDFAHPDGDVTIGDSEYGKVETIVSTQKKIRKMLEKTPTGKYAAVQDVARALGLVKEAGMPNLGQVHATLKEVVYAMLITEEVDNVIWGNQDEWYATDAGEAEHIAIMARSSVHSFIEQKQADFGVDGTELLKLIKQQALKYYTQKGPWGDLVVDDVINFKYLLDSMYSEEGIPLLS